MSERTAARQETVRPPVALMGVPFDNVTMEEAVQSVDGMVRSGQTHCVVTANVDFLVQSVRDAALHRILLEADLVLCDGTPLLWMSKLLGNPLPERVAGSDLTPRLLELADRKGYRIFVLGGSNECNEKAVANIAGDYPDLIVCGHYAPPLAPLERMDHAEILSRIQQARPDVLLVSFGCPKAEKWMSMHRDALGVPVMIGVGGTVDFLAGRLPRAPVWMRRCSLEWLFRIIQEPRRLFARYARDFAFFSVFVLAQLWRTRLRGILVKASPSHPVIQCSGTRRRVVFSGKLDRRAMGACGELMDELARQGGITEIDLSRLRYIDSNGVGLLLRLWRLNPEAVPVLLNPHKSIRATMRLMRLNKFFRMV